MHSLLEVNQPVSVMILDDLQMRRAQIGAFLHPWAEALGVELRARPLIPHFRPEQGCGMVIVPVGGVPIERSVALRSMVELAGELDPVPLVVLSDGSASREIALAFEAGARGYLPASMDPELALKALTFILKGGHFFPPTALNMQPMRPPMGKPSPDQLMAGRPVAGRPFSAPLC